MLKIGYMANLNELKAETRKGLGLKDKKNKGIRCSPGDVFRQLSVLEHRYPGYILPSVEEICGMDVWLGEGNYHTASLDENIECVGIEHGVEGVPVIIKESLEIMQEYLHISNASVQMANVVNEYIFDKKYGALKFKNKTYVERRDIIEDIEEMYGSLACAIKPAIATMKRLVYHSNVVEGFESQNDEVQQSITIKCIQILCQLTKLFKSYRK